MNGSVSYVRKIIKGRFSKLICSREVKVLERLKGLEGVQQIEKQDSETSFISKFIPGVSIEESVGSDISGMLAKVKQTLLEVHNIGICDFDFGNKKDWLINGDRNPVLIDFAASILPGDLFYTQLFKLGCDINFGSLLEFREKLGEIAQFTEEERKLLEQYKRIKRFFHKNR